MFQRVCTKYHCWCDYVQEATDCEGDCGYDCEKCDRSIRKLRLINTRDNYILYLKDKIKYKFFMK